MANWCSTTYRLTGSKKELQEVYEIFTGLANLKHPSVPNGFGSSWLGCIVAAMGGDWEKVSCRGTWCGVDMCDDELCIYTETAWTPCNGVFDLIVQQYPSIRYYYLAEESGCGVYLTNDETGMFFSERATVEVNSKQTDWVNEYFSSQEGAFQWLEEKFDCTIRNEKDVERLNEALKEENDEYFVIYNPIQVAK